MTLTKRSGEIFFHYSQVSADVPDLRVGNDVEFLIENRKDKQVKTLALKPYFVLTLIRESWKKIQIAGPSPSERAR